MFPVQVHLVLNHVPVTGLLFGLVFYILGIKKYSEAALLTGEKIFIAMGAISIAVLASGLRSAHALSASPWLVASEVHLRQRAGILSLIVIIVLGILSGIILVRSRGGHKVGFVGLRRAILVLAMVSFVMVLWTSKLGGELRHGELRSGLQITSFPRTLFRGSAYPSGVVCPTPNDVEY
jgi:uncharacterized membrane protein